MLELDQPGRGQSEGRAGLQPASRFASHVERVAFAGIAFELLSSTPLSRTPEVERYALPPSAHPVVADVLCSISVEPALFAGTSHAGLIELERAGDGELLLRAPRVLASVRKVGPARYACSARISEHESSLASLLRTLNAALITAEGGVIVHAAGIALDGRAILYVGPSGAGKSTAATLTEGAAMFAYDHVALVPHGDGVMAYGLPGGTAARMTQTCDVVLPLAGLFRIRRGRNEPHGELLHGARALFAVRESVESADVALADEQARLQTVSAIAARVRVGALHPVLGKPLASIVRALCEAAA